MASIMVAAARASGPAEMEEVVEQRQVVPGSTLVVGMAMWPESLYLYNAPTPLPVQRNVMDAFMDLPVDTIGYGYEPGILTKVPSLDDGDAVINQVWVGTGDLVVNAYGSVVTLVPGVVLTDANGNQVVFDGTPVLVKQMVVTFSWIENVLWSDGTPLTAADSVFSFQVGCHPDTPTSKFDCDRTESYVASGPYTTVWTGLPGWLNATYMLSYWTPLPEHVLAGMPPGDIPGSSYALQPLGWGPYKVDQYIPWDSIHLSRNPYYWRPGLPQVENLVFKFYPNPELRLEAMLEGEVHVATSDTVVGSLGSLIGWEADGSMALHTTSGSAWEHLDFGMLPADARYVFFNDVEVRRAITLCTNRQQMVDEIFFGRAEVTHAYVSSVHPLYEASNAIEWPYDPGQGMAKLNAAGWLVGDDGWRYKDGQRFAFTLITTAGNETRQKAAGIFKANMAICGIDVTTNSLPSTEFFANGPDGPLWGRKFDMVLHSWLSGIAPPCNLYIASQIPGPANGWAGANAPGYNSPAYDAACSAAQNSLPGTGAYAGNHIQALEIFTQDVPVIPLFFRMRTALSNPNVLNIQPDTTANSELWNVEEWKLGSETMVTPAGGGNLTSNDERVSIQIPAGAVTDTVSLHVTPWLPEGLADLHNGGQFFNLSAAYTANGQLAMLAPGETYSLVVHYSPRQLLHLDSGAQGLGLYYWDGSQWVLDPTSVVDLASHTVTANPDRFGLWALLSIQEAEHLYLPTVQRN